MEEHRIAGRQFGMLTLVMMLAPLIHAILTRIASAERAGWLVMIPAVIPLGLLIHFLFRALERMPEGSGMADLYLTALGRVWGEICCWLNVLWLIMLMLVDLRFYAERYVSAVYPQTGLTLFYVVMLAILFWFTKGDFGDLIRTGKILFWVIVITLIVVLVMAVGKVKLYNVWPVTDTKWKEVGMSTLRMITVTAFAVPASFLVGQVNWKNNKRGMRIWLLLLTGTMVVIAWEIMGVFGPELAARLQVPFFTLAKEITLQGSVKGVEIIVATMWLMSDVAMTGAQVYAAGEIMKRTLPLKQPKIARVGLVCLLLPLCMLLPASSFDMEAYYKQFGMPANIIVGFLLPAVTLTVGSLRKKW